MIKNILKIFSILLILNGCSAITVPPEFIYKEIKTDTFNLASWQKITDHKGIYKVYIEGDGYAFDRHGYPTNDPTPKGTLVREIAFGDKNSNVIYIARPCQFVKSSICSQRHWTTARFAPEVVSSEYQAIKDIVGNSPVVLVGFSGGAQVAGLIATAKHGLNVKKIITIAGNLDHHNWTNYHNLLPLSESLNLADYYFNFIKIPQLHYVGGNDDVILPHMVEEFIKGNANIIVVPEANHNNKWNKVVDEIRRSI